MLHDDTLDRRTVLRALDETVHTLERGPLSLHLGACDALGIGTPEWEACRNQLIEELQAAFAGASLEGAAAAWGEAPPSRAAGCSARRTLECCSG